MSSNLTLGASVGTHSPSDRCACRSLTGFRRPPREFEFDRGRVKRLYERYLGPDIETWDPRFQSYLETPAESSVLVRVDPETVIARDQSYMPSPGC